MCHDDASYTCIMFKRALYCIVLNCMNVSLISSSYFFDLLIVCTVSSITVCFGMFICYILCILQKEEIYLSSFEPAHFRIVL